MTDLPPGGKHLLGKTKFVLPTVVLFSVQELNLEGLYYSNLLMLLTI